MTFLRELLAVILGVFISCFIMFFIMIGVGAAMSNSFVDADKVVVKKNSILTLNFKEEIKDYIPKSDNPFGQIFGFNEDKLGLNEILNAIENAKYDDDILGISIEAFDINAGISQTKALRDKLFEFKESGKFVTAYADIYTQKNYYLSSIADSIYVNPVGEIELKGLASEILFFKDFQDQYGLKMEVVRHGKYKSAVEPFLSDSMSEANREQTKSFLNSIWDQIAMEIAISRNKTLEEINTIADNLWARTPELAQENNIITRKLFRDEYNQVLENLSDVANTEKIYPITMANYIKAGNGRAYSTAKDRIAVVFAQGDIMYGEGDRNYIGQETMLKTFRKLKKDQKVKAVVLRVNSPGGSALASDIIWREIELLKQEKPVVVSMGDLAASGGYYIACNADKIIAQPTTITGSIGVFGMLPNVSSFTDRIGINAEQIGTNKQSVGYSVFEPISESFYKVTEEGIERVYSTFIERVANGRDLSVEQVDQMAQGRVWSGKEALENGLVDELGSLNDAIKVAAELSGTDSYAIRNYPNYDEDIKDIFKSPFGVDSRSIITQELGNEYYEVYENMKALSKLKGVQARVPFLIQIN